jgi:hypothetical protein
VEDNIRVLLEGVGFPPDEAARIKEIVRLGAEQIDKHWDRLRPIFEKG